MKVGKRMKEVLEHVHAHQGEWCPLKSMDSSLWKPIERCVGRGLLEEGDGFTFKLTDDGLDVLDPPIDGQEYAVLVAVRDGLHRALSGNELDVAYLIATGLLEDATALTWKGVRKLKQFEQRITKRNVGRPSDRDQG